MQWWGFVGHEAYLTVLNNSARAPHSVTAGVTVAVYNKTWPWSRVGDPMLFVAILLPEVGGKKADLEP